MGRKDHRRKTKFALGKNLWVTQVARLNLLLEKVSDSSNFSQCRRFGRLALTDRSVGQGRYRRSVRLHLRDDTVDIDGRFGHTYGELRSISTVGSVTLTKNYGQYRRSVRFIVPRNRSISTISVG